MRRGYACSTRVCHRFRARCASPLHVSLSTLRSAAWPSQGTDSDDVRADFVLQKLHRSTGDGTLAAPATLTGSSTGNEARVLSMYPNPATDVLNLMLTENAPIASVVVTDLRGARVAGTTFSNGALNISGLAKGMYTLSVSDGQKVFHQRFVKE